MTTSACWRAATRPHDPDHRHHQTGTEADAATGGGTGATLGTLVGGGAGLLAGIGALAIPGIGPIVAAGWLVAALTGAGVGAAAGGLLGALTQAGIGEEQAEVYAEGVRRGGNLVTVRTDDSRATEVEAIMQRHNADAHDAQHRSLGREPAGNATTPPPPRRSAWAPRPASARAPIGTAQFGTPDGTPGNPPGTMASRGFDKVAGTNVSGAHPENERHRPHAGRHAGQSAGHQGCRAASMRPPAPMSAAPIRRTR